MSEKVIAGVKRTASEMFRLVMEQSVSQLTVKKFCEQNELSAGMYYYWQKKYRSAQAAVSRQAGGFTVLEPCEQQESSLAEGLFAEYKGIRFYRQPSVDFFKQLIG